MKKKNQLIKISNSLNPYTNFLFKLNLNYLYYLNFNFFSLNLTTLKLYLNLFFKHSFFNLNVNFQKINILNFFFFLSLFNLKLLYKINITNTVSLIKMNFFK